MNNLLVKSFCKSIKWWAQVNTPNLSSSNLKPLVFLKPLWSLLLKVATTFLLNDMYPPPHWLYQENQGSKIRRGSQVSARARERDQQGFDFLYCSHTALMMEEVAICALRATRVTRDEETGFRSEKFSFRHSFVLLLQFLHDFLGMSPFSPLSNPSPSC